MSPEQLYHLDNNEQTLIDNKLLSYPRQTVACPLTDCTLLYRSWFTVCQSNIKHLSLSVNVSIFFSGSPVWLACLLYSTECTWPRTSSFSTLDQDLGLKRRIFFYHLERCFSYFKAKEKLVIKYRNTLNAGLFYLKITQWETFQLYNPFPPATANVFVTLKEVCR